MNKNPNYLIAKVEMSGNRYNAFDQNGNKITSLIRTGARKRAFAAGLALERRTGKTGKVFWKKVSMQLYEDMVGTDVTFQEPVNTAEV